MTKLISIFYKPILSSYVSFGSRDVVWENKINGRRILIRETRSFDNPFTLGWTCNLNSEEMKQVLDNKESEELLMFIKSQKKAFIKVKL